MRPSQFISALREGKSRPVYFWTGPDRFLHQECRNAVENSLPPETRAWRLTGVEFQPGLLARQLESAQQMPMLGGRSFFLFSDPDDFRRAADEDAEALQLYLNHPAPFSTVIFAAVEPDRRRRFIQLLEKKAEKVEMEPPSRGEAADWAREYCRSAGVELDRRTAEVLAEKFVMGAAGRDAPRESVNLLWMRTELDKLLTAKAGAKKIGSEELELVPAVREEREIGKMLRALAERRSEEALARMRALLSSKVAETLVLWCIGDLIRQTLKGAGAGSRSAWAARSNPFSTWEIAPLARRNYSRDELARSLSLVRRADLSIKSSWKDSRLLLEMLVWQIAAGKASHEAEGPLAEDFAPAG